MSRELEVIGITLVQVVLVAVGAGPEVDAAQFAQIVKERSGPLKSIVFLYEGGIHWVGPNNLGMTPEMFNDEFQGTFLYRSDGAAVVDVYVKKLDPTSSVVRKKKSVLGGKTEEVRGALDAKTPLDPARDIQFGKGSVGWMNDIAPLDFFWTWHWAEWSDLARYNYAFQGWEEIDGRNCLRFQMSYAQDERKNHDYQRFWVDVERNAHVVRMEMYTRDKLVSRRDISLFELSGEDGKRHWLPAHGHTRWYVWGDKTYEEPISERIIDVINGSARVNVDLPDSLFTVKRATALPAAGELEKLKAASESGSLRKEFEAQPARKPFRTDPASIRKRIDENLAEADRQSKELEASSPARSSWSWTTVAQSALVLLGVAMLAGVGYRKWAGR
jgi:hypothetical protein